MALFYTTLRFLAFYFSFTPPPPPPPWKEATEVCTDARFLNDGQSRIGSDLRQVWDDDRRAVGTNQFIMSFIPVWLFVHVHIVPPPPCPRPHWGPLLNHCGSPGKPLNMANHKYFSFLYCVIIAWCHFSIPNQSYTLTCFSLPPSPSPRRRPTSSPSPSPTSPPFIDAWATFRKLPMLHNKCNLGLSILNQLYFPLTSCFLPIPSPSTLSPPPPPPPKKKN